MLYCHRSVSYSKKEIVPHNVESRSYTLNVYTDRITCDIAIGLTERSLFSLSMQSRLWQYFRS